MKSILHNNFSLDKLKTLSNKELIFLSKEIRNFLLTLGKNKEIHLSSNLGIVELTISLFLNFDFNKDKVIYDTGHQTYVHKILTGRKESLFKLKDLNGPNGLMDMNESSYDHYSPGHSGNVLSVISGISENNLNNFNVVIIGDAALNNGLAFEGLNDISINKNKVIIVINDNQMSISKSNGVLVNYLNELNNNNYSNIKSYANWFENLGFEYIGVIDGHNIKEINDSFELAKQKVNYKPVILHVRTIKGNGLPIVNKDIDGSYHSSVNVNKQTFGKIAYLNLKQKLDNNSSLKILNPAMNIGSGFNELFITNHPNYCDTGICEAGTVSKASGLALSGNRVYLLFYSTFLQRAYDQLLHDCARLNLNITILLDRCDLACNEGDSHHGIFDVAYLKSIPNTNIFTPRDFNQLNQLIDYTYNNNSGINIIRYPTAPFNNQEINSHYVIDLNSYETLIDNNNSVAIITYGPYTNVIYGNILNTNLNVDLYNFIKITNVNKEHTNKLLSKYKTIIIYERIYGSNGLFSEINEIKNFFNLHTKLISMHYTSFMGHGILSELDKKQQMDFNSLLEIVNQNK